jgi:subtilase family serine protease
MEVNSSQPLSGKVWKITLLATKVASTKGTWDAWVDTASCTYPGAFFLPGDGYEIDEHDTIGIPGTARFVVAVGAYVTKTAWENLSGENISRNDLTVGEIASFSAWGPTRDGRVKPDVVAPGMFIVSARAATVPKSNSDPDAFHRVLAGTSMATPHVAGVIALMLQYDPNLHATSIPQILRETTRFDEFTGLISTGSPEWGFGKLDSRAATGFFRVTLVAQGIPANVQIPILIDNARVDYLQGSSWLSLFFLKETRHNISVTHQIGGSSGTRYALASEDLLSLNNSSLRILKYSTQYELSVNSQLGVVAGPGWYDENATAMINVPNHGAATGWLGMIGGELVFTGLVTDDGSSVSGSILMNNPRTVTAVYALTFPLQTYAEFTALLLVIMWTAIYLIRRKIIAEFTSS